MQVDLEMMTESRQINSSITKVNVFLAITAALLSLIGMYNLVSIDLLRRTKEMGIRKIQGAPVVLIVWLAGKRFLMILLISSIVGSLIGYYLSKMLLDSIWDYFVDINVATLIIASLILIMATVSTIAYKIINAAMRNPVDSLRYE
ncbi:MAG: hypothetical protein HZB98_07035 [Bacteroidia bacterium]|nr:hypothetical protein [Bacteroidia bacterium]